MSATETPDGERQKDAMRQQWTANAVGWRALQAQHAITSRAATDLIVEAAQVRPGMHVLDVASGSGEPCLTLAERVGLDGQVTATDLVSDMLAAAEEQARERGLANIRFQQADAEALPFADASFDAVTCRFGVMFFPNVGRALREIRRVLKPGAHAAFIAQGPLDRNPYFAATSGVIARHVQTPPPEPGAPHAQRFAETGTLAAALREAGFQQVYEDYATVPWPIPGPLEQVWESARVRNNVLRRHAEQLTAEQLARIRDDVLAASRPYYDGQQVNFTATVVLASGLR
jgi:ubiquinone/menaquinone biosynthesis C-methylase UbiE